MTLLTYAIIVVVVLLALAPLWHFKPTQQQKKQAKLREAAALAGLFVELRDLPIAPTRVSRLPASERQLLYYGCRLPNTRGAARTAQSWCRNGDAWESFPQRRNPPEIAAQLPDSVLALGVSEASCGLFWREAGDEELVRELAVLLQRWRDELGQN